MRHAARYLGWLGYALGTVSATAAAVYVVVYLYRWEWQRALISGVLLLVLEVFLATAVVLGRVARLQRRLAEADARAEEVLRRLEASRPPSPEPFRWLGERGGPPTGTGTYVFVPVLVAAGAALSMVAVVIQRIAGVSARAGAERRLAGRLATLAAPPGGILGGGPSGPSGPSGPGDPRGRASAPAAGLGGTYATTPPRRDLADQPPIPPARPLRAMVLGLAALAAAVLGVAAVDVVSDATQTRPEPAPASAASTVVFRIELRGGDAGDPQALAQAAHDLWATCHRSTSAPRERVALARLDRGVFAGLLRPGLPEHDLKRLRGCLNDTTANRALARVLGEGQAPPVGTQAER
ncbi:hypothetical protein [Streptomyces sp. 6N223]|uniref:hypothetical protein n=1 Tax=Streptomyces sp. 6N223 TaxID=3457412 RepID=UPI003FD60137